MAKFKNLRGGTFDIFGYSPERKMERQLIADYEKLMADLIPGMDKKNRATITALASLPAKVRGYGPVKEVSVDKMEADKADLLKGLKAPSANSTKNQSVGEPAE